MRKFFLLILALFLFLYLGSGGVNAQSPSDIDCSGGFTTLFPGATNSILYKEIRLTSPREMAVYIVKADINSGDLDFTTTPRDVLGNTTSSFLTFMSADVAINGSGFFTLDDPQGFNSYHADRYSTEDSLGGLGFFISEDNTPTFSNSIPSPLWDALSGFNLLIENGNIYDRLISCPTSNCTATGCDLAYCTVNPRTSLGLNSDDVIIIVVDGRQPGYSQGATLLDMATMMQRCGAENAINLDGGGSTTLAASTGNIFGETLLNQPSDGTERTVSNHFGICIGSCTEFAVNYQTPLPEGAARPRYSLLQNYPFPCDETAPENSSFGDEEFHSLRPYQASPCNPNKEELSLFCAPTLFVGDGVTITKVNNGPLPGDIEYLMPDPIEMWPYNDPSYTDPCTYCAQDASGQIYCHDTGLSPPACNDWGICEPGDPSSCSLCQLNEDGTETCSFVVTQSKSIAVELEGADLPIMGFTEPSYGIDDDPKVINSTNPDEETMDHATKMNNYVSWYLNGVIGRPEYDPLDPTPECIGESSGKHGYCEIPVLGTDYCWTETGLPFLNYPNPTHIEDGKGGCASPVEFCCVSSISANNNGILDRDVVINYSGPIKKLLPFTIQNMEKISEINDAVFSIENESAGIRHSQSAGCYFGTASIPVEIEIKLPVIDESINIDEISLSFPAKCYGNAWWINLLDLFPGLGVRSLHLNEYSPENLPPIEEDEEYLDEPFIEFQEAYREWRGDWCLPISINVPLIGWFDFLFCFNNPFSPDRYSNLFTNVPMSSTEDRLGDVHVLSVGVVPLGSALRLISYNISNVQDADLFFAHMEEGADLASTLQDTFAYKDADKDDYGSSTFVPYEPYCDLREIRTNPGDDLFAGEVSADIDYTVEVSCTYYVWGDGAQADYGNLCENLNPGAECIPDSSGLLCEYYYGQFDCADGYICAQNCGSEVNNTSCHYAVLSTYGVDTGLCVPVSFTGDYCNEYSDPFGPDPDTLCPVDWKCVIDPSLCSPVFEEPNRSQGCYNQVLVGVNMETRTPLIDKIWTRLVGGSASVFRKMFPKVGEGSPVEGIGDIPAATDVYYENTSGGSLYVGNPGYQSTSGNAQLYFPHVGALHEYFLAGIQVALRPWQEDMREIYSSPLEGTDTGTIDDYGSSGTGLACGVYEEVSAVAPYPGGGSLDACQPPTVGWCSVGTLRTLTGFSEEQARIAGIICLRESGGWSNALNDGCLCGRSCDFSIGLFQINALPGRCDPEFDYPVSQAAFYGDSIGPTQCAQPGDWSCSDSLPTPCCIPTNDEAVYECIDYWSNPENNINKMITLSRYGTYWCPWRTGSPSWCGVDFSYCP